MSSDADRRGELLAALHHAGRENSNAAVMFHAAIGARMGLGMTEEKTLDLLEREGPLTAGELTAHTGLAPASVSGLIDRLERKGFVRRVRDREDGRRVIVEINQEHVASFGVLFNTFVAGLEALYAGYTDEQLALILDFLRRSAAVQRDATGELTGQA
ncbi:DNA-binding MarR family transcriptional regulator [Kibdelosporangium banguiense]|uniref:DNA-binding MarR family transcriptional regulator n=1 Tax=Kibdelosporangium banguiense TaxID=1365924 RepID=A0ABS4T7I1_9PSEU|nr:MarR family transcriptional regulator [Kibdelosporangium banguiense]MBP2320380.1 DNA-binding MarR family transcriptional regulator [Kibdelosporangium banguiense]